LLNKYLPAFSNSGETVTGAATSPNRVIKINELAGKIR